MTSLVVHPAGPLAGSVPVPSDADIGHNALVFAALARGETLLHGVSRSDEHLAMVGCLRALGVAIAEPAPGELVVTGVGLAGLRDPAAPLDAGDSAQVLAMVCALLGAQRFGTTLGAGRLLAQHSAAREVRPLRLRGASIEGRMIPDLPGDLFPPLTVGALPEGRRLSPLEYESPVACARVKSAVLLSGLYAEGATLFREPSVSRDHTERMGSALGLPLRTVGPVIQLDPQASGAGWDGTWPGFDMTLPGDLSMAAYLLVAAQLVPGSHVTVRGAGVNPTRTGLLEIARDMGAGLVVEPQGEWSGEPVARLHAWHAPLRGVIVGGETVPRAVSELPLACALAARAAGTTRLRDAGELLAGGPARGPDGPFAPLIAMLRAFGVECRGGGKGEGEAEGDGLDIEGRDEGALDPADLDCGGDARIAMTAAVLALVARGPSRIRDAGCIAGAYPKFVATLRALGAHIEVAA